MSSTDLPHRRRNLLTGEWLLVSPHRAKRPWQGESAPSAAPRPPAHGPFEAMPATGEARVICYAPDCRLLAGELARVRAAVLAGYRQPDGAPPEIVIAASARRSNMIGDKIEHSGVAYEQ